MTTHYLLNNDLKYLIILDSDIITSNGSQLGRKIRKGVFNHHQLHIYCKFKQSKRKSKC